jgi:hypothetical protein
MPTNPQAAVQLTRRALLGNCALGLGTSALAELLAGYSPAHAAAPQRFGGLSGLPHHAPRAKHVIYLLQNGGPPHLDTFDYKPQMEQFRGQELPESTKTSVSAR